MQDRLAALRLNPFFIRSAVGIDVGDEDEDIGGLNPFFIRSAVGMGEIDAVVQLGDVLIPSSSGLLLEWKRRSKDSDPGVS